MTLTEFKAAVSGLGVPFAYGTVRDGQAAPYISYYSTSRNQIFADGRPVYAEEWVTLQLVTKVRDISKEQAVLEMLEQNELACGEPSFDFDEKEHVHIATFFFQIGG